MPNPSWVLNKWERTAIERERRFLALEKILFLHLRSFCVVYTYVSNNRQLKKMSDKPYYTAPILCFVDLDYQEDATGNNMQ